MVVRNLAQSHHIGRYEPLKVDRDLSSADVAGEAVMRIVIGTSAVGAAIMRIIRIAPVVASVAVMEIGAMGSPPAEAEPGAPRRSAIVRSEGESNQRDVQLQNAAGAAADFGPGHRRDRRRRALMRRVRAADRRRFRSRGNGIVVFPKTGITALPMSPERLFD